MTDSTSNETGSDVNATTDTPTSNLETIQIKNEKEVVAMVNLKPLGGKQYDTLVLEQVLQAVSKFGISGKYLRVNNKLYDVSLIPALNAKVVVVDVITGLNADSFPKLEEVFTAIKTFDYNGGILKIGNTYARASAFKIVSQEMPMESSPIEEHPKI